MSNGNNRAVANRKSGGGLAKLSEEAVDFGAVMNWLADNTGEAIDINFRAVIPFQMRLVELMKIAAKKFAKLNEGRVPSIDDLLKPAADPQDDMLVVVRKYNPQTRSVEKSPVVVRKYIAELAGMLYLDTIKSAPVATTPLYTVGLPLFNHEVSPARKALQQLVGDRIDAKEPYSADLPSRLHEFVTDKKGKKVHMPQIVCKVKWAGRKDEQVVRQMLADAAKQAATEDTGTEAVGANATAPVESAADAPPQS